MSHTSDAPETPGPKPGPRQSPSNEIAYKAGVIIAKANRHPSYDAAEAEFLSSYGDRQLKAFEQGYYDGSNGYA